jgi:hypothetical protein
LSLLLGCLLTSGSLLGFLLFGLLSGLRLALLLGLLGGLFTSGSLLGFLLFGLLSGLGLALLLGLLSGLLSLLTSGSLLGFLLFGLLSGLSLALLLGLLSGLLSLFTSSALLGLLLFSLLLLLRWRLLFGCLAFGLQLVALLLLELPHFSLRGFVTLSGLRSKLSDSPLPLLVGLLTLLCFGRHSRQPVRLRGSNSLCGILHLKLLPDRCFWNGLNFESFSDIGRDLIRGNGLLSHHHRLIGALLYLDRNYDCGP